MSKPLSDPNLPAGAIIETFEDGGALRNDGIKLRPANENPWYVLATVYGEQEGEFADWDLHAKNRGIWNRWMCKGMSQEERDLLSTKLGTPANELGQWSTRDQQDWKVALRQRMSSPRMPNAHEKIDLSGLHFSDAVMWESCFFSNSVKFRSCTFSGEANFNLSIFSGFADFSFCTFCRNAIFASSTFGGDAVFESSKFNGYAGFVASTFSYDAFFVSSRFSNISDFEVSTFGKRADFSNTVFESQTMFEDARFLGDVPKFYQREMHQGANFTLDHSKWPAITAKNADASKRAYTRLRVIMNELQKPDDEHFFFRQEMRCKAVSEGWLDRIFIKAYGAISDYGYSVARPLAYLAGVVAIGWALMGGYLKEQTDTVSPIWDGLGLSIANTFPFLGFIRRFHQDVFKDTPNWLEVIAGTQSVLGIMLLFFLGLGLRNRFRLT